MRCLRCALDFGPDERYCDRCGRALSRPIGEKGNDEDSEHSGTPDTAYLYSTFSPPSDAAGIEPPGVPAGTVRAALPQRGGSSHSDANDVDQPVLLSRISRPALPGQIPADPPSFRDEFVRSRSSASGDLDEELDAALADFKLRPGAIGMDARSGRPATPKSSGRRVPRKLLIIGVGAVVVVAGVGLLAQSRHNSYSHDLQVAQRFAAQRQYSAAISSYQQARSDWPFNQQAASEQAQVVATVTTIEAQATAVVLQAQAVATAQVARIQIFGARRQQRIQAAQQNDADAMATATAVAAAQHAQAMVHATAVAQATVQAKAVAQAKANATATAKAIASLPVVPGDSGVSGVVQRVLPSVVRVVAPIDQNTFSEGTGIVIANSAAGSYIVTNDHVVHGSTGSITVGPQSGPALPVVTMAENSDLDLAVLYIKAQLPMAQWGDGATLTVGETVVAIGYAEGMAGSPTVTNGILSVGAPRPDGAGHTFLQHTAPINHGNSGGPLLDLQGRVLGINTFTIVNTQGLFFAIPASVAHPATTALIARIQQGT